MTSESSPVVKKLQLRLMELGYALPKWGADGLGGNETRDALLAFQREHKLAPSGQFDKPTLLALNPPPAHKFHLTEGEITFALNLLAHFPGVPPEIRRILMFPTIVQLLVAFLPGVPDDVRLVEDELRELASDDAGVKKLRTALVFAEALIDRIQAILDKIDPEVGLPNPSQVAITHEGGAK